MVAPMVSLVISFGSCRRVAHHRQKNSDPAMVTALTKLSRLVSQLTGVSKPRKVSCRLASPQSR